MADQIKVFENQAGTNQTGSLSAFSISGVTTNSSTKAVIKDVELKIRHQNPLYEGIYKFPLKTKLNNYTLNSKVEGSSLTLSGSQIVDSSSTFSFEVQAEAQRTYYPAVGIFRNDPSSGQLSFSTNNVSALTSAELADTPTVISNISDPVIIETGKQGYGSTAFLLNGVYVLAYISSSNIIYFIDQYGESLGSITNLPFGVYQLTQDDTYIYATDSSARSTNQFVRIPKSNLTTWDYFSSSTYLNGIAGSNPGFMEHYDGFIYYRSQGSNGSLYKISTTTGTATTINFGTGETEHLGARIVVNTSGVPYIVEWNDQYGKIWNLATGAQVFGSLNIPSGLTNPTTTNNNHTIALAPGVVLINNFSYNQTWVVNVNGSTPTVTNTTSSFPCASGSYIIASTPSQTVGVSVPRDINYDLLITGIEST